MPGMSTRRESPPPRKGFSRVADVPKDLLARLNRGEESTRTLAESLAVDLRILIESLGVPRAAARAIDPTLPFTKRFRLAARVCAQCFGPTAAIARLSTHASDLVRGLSCFVVGEMESVAIERRLELIRPLAADSHFGVREWAWLGVRDSIAADVPRAIEPLSKWSIDPDENIRRFASESTRPRGVWCAHLPPMRANPDIGLPVIEPLRADASRYVQNSVGNWLNDAAKDSPAWAKRTCARWKRESKSASTIYIVGRAMRSMK